MEQAELLPASLLYACADEIHKKVRLYRNMSPADACALALKRVQLAIAKAAGENHAQAEFELLESEAMAAVAILSGMSSEELRLMGNCGQSATLPAKGISK